MRKDGAVRRRYRAKGLTDKGPRDLIFFNEQEQRNMSVLENFERQYNIKCAHLPQPRTHPLCPFGFGRLLGLLQPHRSLTTAALSFMVTPFQYKSP